MVTDKGQKKPARPNIEVSGFLLLQKLHTSDAQSLLSKEVLPSAALQP